LEILNQGKPEKATANRSQAAKVPTQSDKETKREVGKHEREESKESTRIRNQRVIEQTKDDKGVQKPCEEAKEIEQEANL
jgi:hypothetical protein